MFKHEIDHSLFIALMETRDAENLFALIDRNRNHIGEWLKFPSITLQVEDSRNFIEMVRMRYARNEGYWLGIWLEEKLIGSIGFLYFDLDNKKRKLVIG